MIGSQLLLSRPLQRITLLLAGLSFVTLGSLYWNQLFWRDNSMFDRFHELHRLRESQTTVATQTRLAYEPVT